MVFIIFNLYHFIAIDDVKVDKRIIELAKQSYHKEKEKEREENKNASKKDQVRSTDFIKLLIRCKFHT